LTVNHSQIRKREPAGFGFVNNQSAHRPLLPVLRTDLLAQTVMVSDAGFYEILLESDSPAAHSV
jgi:hypothetical protein